MTGRPLPPGVLGSTFLFLNNIYIQMHMCPCIYCSTDHLRYHPCLCVFPLQPTPGAFPLPRSRAAHLPRVRTRGSEARCTLRLP